MRSQEKSVPVREAFPTVVMGEKIVPKSLLEKVFISNQIYGKTSSKCLEFQEIVIQVGFEAKFYNFYIPLFFLLWSKCQEIVPPKTQVFLRNNVNFWPNQCLSKWIWVSFKNSCSLLHNFTLLTSRIFLKNLVNYCQHGCQKSMDNSFTFSKNRRSFIPLNCEWKF